MGKKNEQIKFDNKYGKQDDSYNNNKFKKFYYLWYYNKILTIK